MPSRSSPTHCRRHGTFAYVQNMQAALRERRQSSLVLLLRALFPRYCNNLYLTHHPMPTHTQARKTCGQYRRYFRVHLFFVRWSRCVGAAQQLMVLATNSPGVHPEGRPEDGGLSFHIRSRYSLSFAGFTSNTLFPRALPHQKHSRQASESAASRPRSYQSWHEE